MDDRVRRRTDAWAETFEGLRFTAIAIAINKERLVAKQELPTSGHITKGEYCHIAIKKAVFRMPLLVHAHENSMTKVLEK